MFSPKFLLSYPFFYHFFDKAIGASRFRKKYIKQFVKPKNGDKILDIGCGTGHILDFLPQDIHYVGFDSSLKYIERAKFYYQNKGDFFCSEIGSFQTAESNEYDIVMANGVMHHLSDEDVLTLLKLAVDVLKLGGRFVSFDGCFTKEQSPLVSYFLKNDRGAYVRTEDEYNKLITNILPDANFQILNNELLIPYCHLIVTYTNIHNNNLFT